MSTRVYAPLLVQVAGHGRPRGFLHRRRRSVGVVRLESCYIRPFRFFQNLQLDAEFRIE